MKNIALSLICVFIGVPAAMSQSFDLTRETESFTVAGIPVVLRTPPATGDISDEITAIRVTAFGGVNLTKKAGLLGLMTNSMAKGTYTFSKEDIDNLLTKTGASLSLDASNDDVVVAIKSLKRFLPDVLPLLSELLRLPKFDEKEIELVRQQTMAALQSEDDDADSLLRLQMHKLFFKGHPYYNRPSGYLDTVPTITRSEIASLFQKTFNKGNIIVTIVGNLNREQVEALLTKYLSSMPDGNRTLEVSSRIQNEDSQVHFVQKEAPATYFYARFKAPSLESEDYPALSIAMQILDYRLFREVRTKKALARNVYAGLGGGKANSGSVYVLARDVVAAADTIFAEIEDMKTTPVTEERLRLSVNKFLSGWYSSREARSTQAAIFALYEVMGIGWENSNSFIQRLERVTPQDVQEVMKKYARNLTAVVAGTEPKGAEVQNVLAKYGYFKKVEAVKPEMTPEAEPEESVETKPKG